MDKRVYNIICGIIATYEQRKKLLDEEISNLILIKSQDYEKTFVDGGKKVSNIELAYDKEFNIKDTLRYKYVNAVDKAKSHLILAEGKQFGDKLFKAICLNCNNRRAYNFTALNNLLDLFMSYRNFYYKKEMFIKDIAGQLDFETEELCTHAR